MRRLDEQPLAPDGRDDFLPLLLGALSSFARIEALLAPGPAPACAPGGRKPDAVVFAALGWISLQRSFERWICEAIAEGGGIALPPRSDRSARRAGILR